MKFGAHVSISGGVFNAPQNGKDVTCEVIQIFTKNQQQWRVKPLTDEEVEKFKAEEKRTGVQAVCVHASYLINLGGFDKQKVYLSRQNFIAEMERAEALGIPYLVIHPGSHLDEGEQKGIQRISESLNFVFDKCPDFKLKILLETTAGQGSNLGYTFEQLAEMKSKVEAQEKIGVCMDTCHIFAAGYELRNEEGYEKTVSLLDKIIGCDQVSVIHVNDSKKEFGSRRDRHEHIGEGEIGIEAFKFLMNDPRFTDVSIILETPKGPKNDMDIENLKRLRGLVETK